MWHQHSQRSILYGLTWLSFYIAKIAICFCFVCTIFFVCNLMIEVKYWPARSRNKLYGEHINTNIIHCARAIFDFCAHYIEKNLHFFIHCEPLNLNYDVWIGEQRNYYSHTVMVRAICTL
jgi:hypothetical protein